MVVLLAVAFITLLERKWFGFSQLRISPNKVLILGILQPVLDGVKLFLKEFSILIKSNFFLYFCFPALGLRLSLVIWFFFIYYFFLWNERNSLLFLLVCLGLSVYITLIIGWASNSKYSLLGALRASAQSISYEISLSIILIGFFFFFKTISSWNYSFITSWWGCILFLPLLLILFLSFLAECNRAPFDFAEGESELVSGFNVEFRALTFALIFLAEYGIIVFFSVCLAVVGASSRLTFFFIFLLLNRILFVRRVYPRFRYDKLIFLIWFKVLPLRLFFLLFEIHLRC